MARAATWPDSLPGGRVACSTGGSDSELDGVAPFVPKDLETLPRRTTELVADLVEPARAEALEKVGKGARAFGIASEWMRRGSHPLVGTDGVGPP